MNAWQIAVGDKVTCKIGIVNVQGAVSEHVQHVSLTGATPLLVKHAEDLAQVDGLILPGGESTTIGKLIRKYGLFEPIRERVRAGMPVFGTCAGMILLAQQIEGQDEAHLDVLDVTVNRNSFGRQRESFEAYLAIVGLAGGGFPSVFIRAPHVVEAGVAVEVLAAYEGKIVAVKQGHVLATSFHPELTTDIRLHQLFKDMVDTRIVER